MRAYDYSSFVSYTSIFNESDLEITVSSVIDHSITGDTAVKNAGKLQDTLAAAIVPQAVNAIFTAYPTFKAAYDKGMVSTQIGLKMYQESSSTLAYVASSFYKNNPPAKISGIELNLSVNMNSLNFDGAGNLTPESRRDLESTIAHEMIHAFMDDLTFGGMVGAVDGVADETEKYPKWFKEGMAQTAGGGFNGWADNAMGIFPNTSVDSIKSIVTGSGNTIKNEGTNPSSASSYGTGYLAVMYLGYMSGGGVSAGGISGGLNKILNDLMNGKSLDDVINKASKGKYTGVNDFQNNFGDDASADFVHRLAVATGNGNGSVIGSLAATDLIPDNPVPGNAYVVNKNSIFVPSNVRERNWGSGSKTQSGNNTSVPGGLIPLFGSPINTGNSFPHVPDYIGGTINLFEKTWTPAGYESSRKGVLNLHVGADANNKMGLHIDEMSAKALGLNGVSVLDIKRSLEASNSADIALARITANRARIGAYVNRLEHTIKNLDNVVENTQAAESIIRDTDMASEMVSFSKYNILMQAGTAMLTQANQTPQGVMTLLG